MDANRLKTCNCCGSKLNLSLLEKNKYVKCEYCDAYNDINIHDEKFERLIDEVKIELRNGNFDKADEKVEELLSTYKDEPLVYFYKVLVDCKIVYVKEDPDDEESKGIPTYTSIKFNSPAVTKYGKKCLEKEKDSKIAASYEKVFNTIERDREAIKKLLTDKDPRHDYDVFICFKKSDVEDPSKDTPEAKEAQRLYTYLCKTYGDKLKIFYAPESLDGSAPWEQLIFNALARAKLLIVIGYSSDTLNATWVKNEWNRFIDMMEDGNFGDKEIFVAGASDGNVSYIPTKLKKYQAKPADTSLHAEIKKTIDDVIFYSQNNDKEENTPKEVAQIKKTVKYEMLQDVGKIEQAKVRTYDHSHSEADVEIDLILAKTNPELALKHLSDIDRYPNQDDQAVKKAKFFVKNEELINKKKPLTLELFESIKEELEDIIDSESYSKIFSFLIEIAQNNREQLKFRVVLIKYLFEHYDYIKDNKNYTELLVRCSYNLFVDKARVSVESWKDALDYFDDLYKITYSKCDEVDLSKNNLTYFVCLRAISLFPDSKVKEYLKGLPQDMTFRSNKEFNLTCVKYYNSDWVNLFANPIPLRAVVYAERATYLIKNNKYGPYDIYDDLCTIYMECINETEAYSSLAVLYYLEMVYEFLAMVDVRKSDTGLLDEYYELTIENVIRNNKTDEVNAKFVTEQHKLFKDAIELMFKDKSEEELIKEINAIATRFTDAYLKDEYVRMAKSYVKSKNRQNQVGKANHAATNLINKKITELGKKAPQEIFDSIDDLILEKDPVEYNKKANRILDVVDNQIAEKMKRERRKVFAAQIMYAMLCIAFASLLGYFGFFDHNSIKARNEETGIIIAYALAVFASGCLFTYPWLCKKRENNLTEFMHCALGGIIVFLSYLFFASFGYLIYADVGHALVTDTFYVVRMTLTPVIGVLLFIVSIVCFGDIRELDYFHLAGTAVFIAVNIFASKLPILYMTSLLFAAIGFVNYFRITLYHEKTSMRICTLISFAIAIAVFSVCIPTFQFLGNEVYLAASNIKWLEVIYLILYVIVSGAPIIGLTWYNIYLMVSGNF